MPDVGRHTQHDDTDCEHGLVEYQLDSCTNIHRVWYSNVAHLDILKSAQLCHLLLLYIRTLRYRTFIRDQLCPCQLIVWRGRSSDTGSKHCLPRPARTAKAFIVTWLLRYQCHQLTSSPNVSAGVRDRELEVNNSFDKLRACLPQSYTTTVKDETAIPFRYRYHFSTCPPRTYRIAEDMLKVDDRHPSSIIWE